MTGNRPGAPPSPGSAGHSRASRGVIWSAVALASVFAIASCGDGGATEPPPALAEFYALEAVDGRPLPAIVDTVDGTEWTLSSGSLSIVAITFSGETRTDASRAMTYSLRRGDEYTGQGAEMVMFRLRQEGRAVILSIGPPSGYNPAMGRSDTGRVEADGRLMVRTRLVMPDGPPRVLAFAPSSE